jgi:predicted RNase H-like HicB family nuclease
MSQCGENMHLTIETEREDDGRWLAEVPELPGAIAYGKDEAEAMARVEALALRILAERIESGDATPMSVTFALSAT